MSSKLPQKKYFRQRAHSNPFSDHNLEYPACPSEMDWDSLYPNRQEKLVDFCDVGCGYGGLLVSLSPLFPDKLMLGMELRVKVTDYVKQRIDVLQQTNASYNNIAVLRTNAMKFLPNFFVKGQLEKIFFLFPDPHFKKKKHKARIINQALLAEYAYFLKPQGLLYIATDVLDLFTWMTTNIEMHPMFEKIEPRDDPVIVHILGGTEEGQKVTRNKGEKYFAVYRRLPDPV